MVQVQVYICINKSYEKQYQDAYRAYHIRSSRDFTLKDYLIYWLENVFSRRVENSTKMLSGYVLYDLLLPQMVQDTLLMMEPLRKNFS